MLNRIILRTFPYFIFPVLFILTGSQVFAIETAKVNPTSLSLNKGETKKLVLTGKNLSNAKSALVFLKNSPKREFTTQLICKGTTSCIVSLTIKTQVAQGSYSVKLFDTKKNPIAEAKFKIISSSEKSPSRASREKLGTKPKGTPSSLAKADSRSRGNLKSKSKQTPLAEKVTPKSSRELRSKSKSTSSPETKAVPRTRDQFRVQSKQAPSVGKTTPPQSQLKSLRDKSEPPPTQNKDAPQRTRPSKPDKVQEKSSGQVKLASIKLAKQKAASGEVIKGTVFLEGRAPVPKGVEVKLSSSNPKIATIKPVRIRAGQTKADFSFKTGSMLGTVTIKAQLGKVTLAAKLKVTAAPFRSVTIGKGAFLMTGRRPAAFTPITIGKGAFLMTGRRPAAFAPITIGKGAFLMTGRRPTAFAPITIDKGAFLMTGRRPEGAQSPDTPLISPLNFVLKDTLRMTGQRFNPLNFVLTDTLQMTGRPPTPFTPVVIDPGALEMTGRRPIQFNPVVIDPGALEMTGRRKGSANNQ